MRFTVVLCVAMILAASVAVGQDLSQSWTLEKTGSWDEEPSTSKYHQWNFDVTQQWWYIQGQSDPTLRIRSATLAIESWDNYDGDPKNMMFVDLLDPNTRIAAGGTWKTYSDYYKPSNGYPDYTDEFQQCVNETGTSTAAKARRAYWYDATQLATVHDYEGWKPETWSHAFTSSQVAALNEYIWLSAKPGTFAVGFDVDCAVKSDNIRLDVQFTPELPPAGLAVLGLVVPLWLRRRKRAA